MFLFQTQGVKIEVFVENREMNDNVEFTSVVLQIRSDDQFRTHMDEYD